MGYVIPGLVGGTMGILVVFRHEVCGWVSRFVRSCRRHR